MDPPGPKPVSAVTANPVITVRARVTSITKFGDTSDTNTPRDGFEGAPRTIGIGPKKVRCAARFRRAGWSVYGVTRMISTPATLLRVSLSMPRRR
jgi:hypothetical protein